MKLLCVQVVQGAQRIMGQGGGGEAEPVPLPTPPGLAPMDVKLIEGKTAPSGDRIHCPFSSFPVLLLFHLHHLRLTPS